MENLFFYLLKASGLLITFFLAYHFLLRKETFFNANRWFLLLGLFTSALLPLYTITKIVYIEPQPQNQSSYDTFHSIPVQESATIDWTLVVTFCYVLISAVLLLKIVINLTSVLRLINQKERIKKGSFSIVNLTENLAPFSFFNYIALNPDLYTDDELESILLHEKVHSREKHSADILLANIFCVLFWFNPFMWFYKKAIIQNLEYIADQKATQKCQNKTNYQKALVRVITHQNYLSITNHFNQSLIKKRIVMLNTSPSKRHHSLKYIFVLPILIYFVILFQVEVIAQERFTVQTINQSLEGIEKRLEINKNTSDAVMTREKEVFKKEFDTDLKFSKVKRNSNGELTSIKIDVKTPNGKSETYQFSGSEPIKPFVLAVSKNENGLVKVNYGTSAKKTFVWKSEDAVVDLNNLEELKELEMDIEIDIPDAPEAPGSLNWTEAPAPPSPPSMGHNKKIVIVKENNGKATVTVNGKVIEDPENYLMEIDSEGLQNFNFDFDWETSDGGQVSGEKVYRIKKEAGESGLALMYKMQPDLMQKRMEVQYKQLFAKQRNKMIKQNQEVPQLLYNMIILDDNAKNETNESRQKIIESRNKMASTSEEMEQAKKEIELAKIELLKAKEELEKAKKELEAAKLKKQ